MKILYVIPKLNNAGPVNQLFNLISSLNRDLYQSCIVTMYEEEENSRKEDFIKADIDVICLKLKNKYFNINDKALLKKIIAQVNPDIIHTAALPADRLMFRVRTKKVWCLTIHCNIYKDYIGRFKRPINMLYMIRHEKYFHRADVPICCSKTLMHIYARHGISALCVLNGVLTEQYHPVDAQVKSVIREKFGFTKDEKVVLIVGSLDERKRSLFIINTLKEHVRNRKLKLIFCGTGVKEKECEQVAGDCKEIIFAKQVKNMAEYYQAADCYLSASGSEGLPMSVIEAGCTGLPMLLSDISQHRELAAGADNLAGINFFRLDHAGELQQGFKELLGANVDNRLIAKHFADHFSARKMGERYEKIYDQILHEKTPLRLRRKIDGVSLQ